MIVDDYHALAAILLRETRRWDPESPTYLDARVPAIMHLRLVSALHKFTPGRLAQLLHVIAPDGARRASLVEAVGRPNAAWITVLDDRPLAMEIGVLTAEPGVSIAFGALISHSRATGHPIMVDPANQARWMDVARSRGVEVVALPARI